MPLLVEHLTCPQGEPNGIPAEHIPGDPPGSISHFSVILGRQIFLFQCGLDDQDSIIAESPRGATLTDGPSRIVMSDAGMRQIARLTDGQTYEMTVLPDNSLLPIHLRFTHRYVDFGTRTCPMCTEDIPTGKFGRHVTTHLDEISQGRLINTRALLDCYRLSIIQSIRAAHGFPRLQRKLRQSLADIAALQGL